MKKAQIFLVAILNSVSIIETEGNHRRASDSREEGPAPSNIPPTLAFLYGEGDAEHHGASSSKKSEARRASERPSARDGVSVSSHDASILHGGKGNLDEDAFLYGEGEAPKALPRILQADSNTFLLQIATFINGTNSGLLQIASSLHDRMQYLEAVQSKVDSKVKTLEQGIISCQTDWVKFNTVKDHTIEKTVSLTGFKNKPRFIASLIRGVYAEGDTLKGVYIAFDVYSATSASLRVIGQNTVTYNVEVAWMACGH